MFAQAVLAAVEHRRSHCHTAWLPESPSAPCQEPLAYRASGTFARLCFGSPKLLTDRLWLAISLGRPCTWRLRKPREGKVVSSKSLRVGFLKYLSWQADPSLGCSHVFFRELQEEAKPVEIKGFLEGALVKAGRHSFVVCLVQTALPSVKHLAKP